MPMTGYTKLFNSILASTIWREDDKTRIVWITLLAMADKRGHCEGSIPGLADFARVSLRDCEAALQRLSSPDAYSRSKEHDGRRIEPIDGGWRLINHGKYREKLGADERREYLRIKQQEHRKRQQQSTKVNNVSDKYTPSTHTAPDTYTEATTQDPSLANSLSPLSPTVKVVRASEKPIQPDDVQERAGRLVERYGVLFLEHRAGARHRSRPNLDWTEACDLCRVWTDDARLEKLAILVLTTDDTFIANTDRSFKIFALKASWADDRLRQWELKHGITS